MEQHVLSDVLKFFDTGEGDSAALATRVRTEAPKLYSELHWFMALATCCKRVYEEALKDEAKASSLAAGIGDVFEAIYGDVMPDRVSISRGAMGAQLKFSKMKGKAR